jgi:hypothetical protein
MHFPILELVRKVFLLFGKVKFIIEPLSLKRTRIRFHSHPRKDGHQLSNLHITLDTLLEHSSLEWIHLGSHGNLKYVIYDNFKF